MLAGFSVANEFLGATVQVLLRTPYTFLEGRWCWLIQNLHSAPWSFSNVDLVEASVLVAATGGNDPDLSRGQRIAANTVFAVKLGSGNKLLHSVLAHRVAELGVTEFRRANAFLLLLDSAPAFQCDAQSPLQHLIGHRRVRV